VLTTIPPMSRAMEVITCHVGGLVRVKRENITIGENKGMSDVTVAKELFGFIKDA